jgi:glycosyltransferase involved in cell wall biosynthesis
MRKLVCEPYVDCLTDSRASCCILVLCSNARDVERSLHWERLKRHVSAITPNVFFLSSHLSYEEMDHLMADIDCYASLHRAEGMGLGMLKAAALGKPVIGTGYSGNMDFTTEDYAYPVEYQMIDVSPKAFLYGDVVGARWADANITHAAELMKKVYEERGVAKNVKGEAAKAYIQKRYDLERVGRLSAERIAYLAAMMGRK